jgi:parallel beta-helix repeat protein
MARIYISSTYSDLKDARDAVYGVLRKMGHNTIAMEDYVATDQRPLDKCLADVDSCDVYIGIFAWRYGYIPPDEDRSITELEFRETVRTGKPCLMFLLHEEAPWPRSQIDRDSSRIEGLREELSRDYTVGFFRTADELASLVSVAVGEVLNEVPLGDRLPRTPSSRTRVVDAMYRGDHVTITEAIEVAAAGDRILVRPGLYEEGLVVDKPLEIVGHGNLEEIVVEATGSNALFFETTMGRVSNLTLRQVGGEGQWFGVEIAQGRLELSVCDISSDSLACVGIYGSANPMLRNNRIHDGKNVGVYILEGGKGTLEDNDIFGNTASGVEIKGEGSDPTLRNNRIQRNKAHNVRVANKAGGRIEDNDLSGRHGWLSTALFVSSDSKPNIESARNKT